MNLWIRSQDKRRLLKIDNFLQNFKDVITFTKEEGLIVLGTYQSEKRALEVLDEIQNILMPQVKVIYNKTEEVKLQDFTSNIIAQPVIEDIQIQQASSYVYEMPKE